MMNQLPVRQCQYCGGKDIRVGWQSDALVTFKRNGLLGNRIKFLICGNCGAVLYQCVAEPHRFPQGGKQYVRLHESTAKAVRNQAPIDTEPVR